MTPATRRGARTLHLLVSSMSAGGRSVSIGPTVVRILRAGGWSVRVSVTTSSDDPTALAASSTEDVVAALGGDGYIAAVARGCHESSALFAPLPGGRGNDLCRALGIGADPLRRARALAPLGFRDEGDEDALSERSRMMDGIWVESAAGRRLVLGIISLGLDARANILANESWLNHGPLAYGYGAFAALATYRPGRVEAVVDGQERDLAGWVTSISNSGCFGGGIRLVPSSNLHDGRIELCHVDPLPFSTVLPILAKIVVGRSAVHPAIEVEQVTTVEIREPKGLVAMADGDRVASVPFTASAAPQIVNVLL